VREEWRVVDRWWTDQPVQRRYFDVVLESGENAVVFYDDGFSDGVQSDVVQNDVVQNGGVGNGGVGNGGVGNDSEVGRWYSQRA
jgi:hypothetical protein